MRRCLFAFLSAVSLLLCVASCALWVRSHLAWDFIEWRSPRGKLAVEWTGGAVRVNRVSREPGFRDELWGKGLRHQTFDPRPEIWPELPGIPRPPPRSFAGFVYDGLPPPYAPWEWWTVPLWAPAAATVVLPALWAVGMARRVRAARRRRSGRCAACGYDLRATLERCPECGTVPADGISSHDAGHTAFDAQTTNHR